MAMHLPLRAQLLMVGGLKSWLMIGALSLGIGIGLLVWVYQVHALRRGQASFSPGMAVGVWFIPVANMLLIPMTIRSAILDDR